MMLVGNKSCITFLLKLSTHYLMGALKIHIVIIIASLNVKKNSLNYYLYELKI